ncbi:L-threonylcarbamoyladenylate synthase [Thermobrachium celere]|uniref:Threonylcarbamoyl-AMP synthase n=1 Tax=Thermobrachium celere DSM 8682 TaxID=941824 RepID=R7RMB1_9CLOT|nr:L-threonylcarbamoyladenylate synthase [Thermobrachium celere]CDF57312.1 YrdC/Sua5 family protein, required for threonylcarbamoyladenosine (t(6)A) formation in tRNA [Thermobrachium celere DSM 8682]
MDTKVYYLDEHQDEKIREAAEVIKRGGLVVFPTETVYGLGANALDEEACRKIFIAKGRPQDNPLIVHVADFDISDYVEYIPENAKKIMENFWPGPITMVLKKSSKIPMLVTANLDSVAIRMPSNKVARKLIEYSGVPIAAPSANISGRPSPTTIEHAIEDLMGRVDMIIGGEKCEFGLESTVVEVLNDKVTILRPGAITKDMLEDIGLTVDIDPAILKRPDENLKPKSPGMKYRHYAPKAEMTIVTGRIDRAVDYINYKIKEMKSKGKVVGVLATEETKQLYEGGYIISVGSRNKLGLIAANLFDTLREFDKINVDYIYAEGFEEEGLGLAIMNRMKKAASYNIINV